MSNLNTCLYEGTVMHHRLSPAKHKFRYRVFSTLIDLDELPWLNKLRLFSVNRFNLFSFHEADHGVGCGQLAGQIRQLLIQRGYANATSSIKLLCYPRILGYTFNPLSVYFCYNRDNQLKVILYEVSNTFGSRHTYLLEALDEGSSISHSCEKRMYVSPFMEMETAYSFRISPPDRAVIVDIQQHSLEANDKPSKPIFHAVLQGNKQDISDRSLLSVFSRFPLMTLKVTGAIHWEALRLWRKKLKIQPRSKEQTRTISWLDRNGVSHYESI